MYYSDSGDSYSLWDDYDDSYETTPPPRLRPTTTSAKVILRNKVPKVNVTVKTSKGDDKKIIKTTNINIESHTNFIVTKAPVVSQGTVTRRPVIQISEDYVIVESPELHADQFSKSSTKKPVTSRRPSSSKRPTTKRPPTTRRSRPPLKTTKAPKVKKPTCPPKSTGWLSSFFQDVKEKKTPKKPAKSGWLLGGFEMDLFGLFANNSF